MDPRFKDKGNTLGRFIEECGEALAAAGKTVRYGRESFNPLLPRREQETNGEWLRRESVDVLFAMKKLADLWGWDFDKMLRDAEAGHDA